jgi:hypothetical protein
MLVDLNIELFHRVVLLPITQRSMDGKIQKYSLHSVLQLIAFQDLLFPDGNFSFLNLFYSTDRVFLQVVV